MRSYPLPMRNLTLALLAPLALTACAGGPRIETLPVAFDCSARVPPQLRADVQGADLPEDNTVGGWVAFADAQTGKLESANDRKTTALWIIDQCEGEEKEAAERIKPRPWWRFWSPPDS